MNKKIIVSIVVGILIIGGIVYARNIQTTSEQNILTIDNTTLKLIIADSPDEQSKGLSDRPSLDPNSGMLFVFEKPGHYGFWMKDMHFNIDMIWLDEAFKVVYIQPDATPGSYPTSYGQEAEAKYVLETNAGFAKVHNIRLGQQLNIK
jgi:uncharacterized membrane protein (UPF0127 family)